MPSVDRRQHARRPLAASVQFHHAPSKRDFPGRCVDVSEGGMLLYVPANTPIQAGHPIRLRMPKPPPAAGDDPTYEPVDATVVRVDRHGLLSMGHIAVGVKFARRGK